MSVDASAVARVVGITPQFKDLRAGNILFLQQRIAILAAGRKDVTYSTEKYQITSAKQAAIGTATALRSTSSRVSSSRRTEN